MRKYGGIVLLSAHTCNCIYRFPSHTKTHQNLVLEVSKYPTITANAAYGCYSLLRGVYWPEEHLWSAAYGCISLLTNTDSAGFISRRFGGILYNTQYRLEIHPQMEPVYTPKDSSSLNTFMYACYIKQHFCVSLRPWKMQIQELLI